MKADSLVETEGEVQLKSKKLRKALVMGSVAPLTIALVTAIPTTTASAATTTLTWMLPVDPLIDAWGNAVIKGFEKANPGVTVKLITPSSTADYPTKLLTLVASGQTPDVFADWGGMGVMTIFTHNLALNLTDYLKKNHEYNRIPTRYRNEFTYKGGVYGIPWNSNPNFIVYNVDMFKKAHVPLPPSSWADKKWNLNAVLADAKKLTNHASNPKSATYGAIFAPSSFSLGSFAWLWGADPFNSKGGPQDSAVYHGAPVTATYAISPGMVKAATWLTDLMNKYKVSPSMGQQTAMSTSGNPFFTGKIAMDVVAGGWLERQAAVAKPKFHWAIAPFPYGPAGVDAAQREDNGMYVSNTAPNKALAEKLLTYATFGPGRALEIKLAKDNPPMGTAKDFTSWQSQVMLIPGLDMSARTFASVFKGGLTHDLPDPSNVVNNASQFNNAWTQVMAPVWNGQESVQKGLASLQSNWKQYLQH